MTITLKLDKRAAKAALAALLIAVLVTGALVLFGIVQGNLEFKNQQQFSPYLSLLVSIVSYFIATLCTAVAVGRIYKKAEVRHDAE